MQQRGKSTTGAALVNLAEKGIKYYLIYIIVGGIISLILFLIFYFTFFKKAADSIPTPGNMNMPNMPN